MRESTRENVSMSRVSAPASSLGTSESTFSGTMRPSALAS